VRSARARFPSDPSIRPNPCDGQTRPTEGAWSLSRTGHSKARPSPEGNPRARTRRHKAWVLSFKRRRAKALNARPASLDLGRHPRVDPTQHAGCCRILAGFDDLDPLRIFQGTARDLRAGHGGGHLDPCLPGPQVAGENRTGIGKQIFAQFGLNPAETARRQKGAHLAGAHELGIACVGGILASEVERFSNALAEPRGRQFSVALVRSFIDDDVPPIAAVVFAFRADAPEIQQVRRHLQHSLFALHSRIGRPLSA
jgi:hypothetical protein